MVAPDDLLTRGLINHLTLTWRAGLVVSELGPSDISAMQQAIPGIAPSLGAALPAQQPVTVSTGLTPVLADVQQSLALAQGGVTLLTLQFVVLAAFAVILVAALLAERRRRENRILVSRGGTQIEIVMITAAEAILVTLPAVILAPPAAALVIHLLGARRSAGQCRGRPAPVDLERGRHCRRVRRAVRGGRADRARAADRKPGQLDPPRLRT